MVHMGVRKGPHGTTSLDLSLPLALLPRLFFFFLAAPGLSCGIWHTLVAACKLLVVACEI